MIKCRQGRFLESPAGRKVKRNISYISGAILWRITEHTLREGIRISVSTTDTKTYKKNCDIS